MYVYMYVCIHTHTCIHVMYAYIYKNVPAKDIRSWILMPFTQWDSAACGKMERCPS